MDYQPDQDGSDILPVISLVVLVVLIIAGAAWSIYSKEGETRGGGEEIVIVEELPTDDFAEKDSEEGDVQSEQEDEVLDPIFDGKQGEDIIKIYYSYLADGELDLAYAMYETPFTDKKTFNSWYKGVTYVSPYQFTDIGDNTYRFFVDIKEVGVPDETYEVTMEVLGAKINTKSSVLINSLYSDKTQTYFVRRYKERADLMYQKNGRVYKLSSGEDYRPEDYDESESTAGLPITQFEIDKISADDRYVLIDKHRGAEGGEASFTQLIFDSKQNKIIHEDSAYMVAISDDEKHFYACESSDYTGNFSAKVYSLPSVTVVYDATESPIFADLEYYDLECQFAYDGKQSVLIDVDVLSYKRNPDVGWFRLTYDRQNDTAKFSY